MIMALAVTPINTQEQSIGEKAGKIKFEIE
jgi:hypothetical protein